MFSFFRKSDNLYGSPEINISEVAEDVKKKARKNAITLKMVINVLKMLGCGNIDIKEYSADGFVNNKYNGVSLADLITELEKFK